MINTIMEMTAIKGLARKAALGLAVGMLLLAPVAAEAHCDTMDGPTVKVHWSTYFGHKISKIRCQKNK